MIFFARFPGRNIARHQVSAHEGRGLYFGNLLGSNLSLLEQIKAWNEQNFRKMENAKDKEEIKI